MRGAPFIKFHASIRAKILITLASLLIVGSAVIAVSASKTA